MDGRGERNRLGLLVVSSLYPPLHLGGYELGCAQIVDGLRDRGHEVTVLTSRHGLDGPRAEGHVHRCLFFRPDQAGGSLAAIFRRERGDQQALLRLMADVNPDLVYVFSLYGVSAALPLTAQRAGRLVAYAFSAEWLEPGYRGDPWLGFWGQDASTHPRRALKRVIRRFLDPAVPTGLEHLDLRHAYFTSRRLRELFLAKGFPVEGAEVIHWGVDLEKFHPPARPGGGDSLRLLFAGRIAQQKGLHTAVEALTLLQDEADTPRVTLTVAGPVQEADYLESVGRHIEQCGLQGRVRFLGPVPCEAMPQLYREHDVFLFPSIWEEPFSIGLIEAMASGLAVIGTRTGGSGEALADGMNGLAFPPGDAGKLAWQLRRLFDPGLRQRLGREARRSVERGFGMGSMVERIEGFLRKVSQAEPRRSAGGGRHGRPANSARG